MHLMPRTVAVVAVAGKGACAAVGGRASAPWLVGRQWGGYGLDLVGGVGGDRIGGGVCRMGSRERFFATVRHERPDRVPLDLWARPEVMRELREYLGTDDVDEALGIDFGHAGVGSRFPEFEATAAEPRTATGPGRLGPPGRQTLS